MRRAKVTRDARGDFRQAYYASLGLKGASVGKSIDDLLLSPVIEVEKLRKAAASMPELHSKHRYYSSSFLPSSPPEALP